MPQTIDANAVGVNGKMGVSLGLIPAVTKIELRYSTKRKISLVFNFLRGDGLVALDQPETEFLLRKPEASGHFQL
jgi:hypothetical protein